MMPRSPVVEHMLKWNSAESNPQDGRIFMISSKGSDPELSQELKQQLDADANKIYALYQSGKRSPEDYAPLFKEIVDRVTSELNAHREWHTLSWESAYGTVINKQDYDTAYRENVRNVLSSYLSATTSLVTMAKMEDITHEKVGAYKSTVPGMFEGFVGEYLNIPLKTREPRVRKPIAPAQPALDMDYNKWLEATETLRNKTQAESSSDSRRLAKIEYLNMIILALREGREKRLSKKDLLPVLIAYGNSCKRQGSGYPFEQGMKNSKSIKALMEEMVGMKVDAMIPAYANQVANRGASSRDSITISAPTPVVTSPREPVSSERVSSGSDTSSASKYQAEENAMQSRVKQLTQRLATLCEKIVKVDMNDSKATTPLHNEAIAIHQETRDHMKSDSFKAMKDLGEKGNISIMDNIALYIQRSKEAVLLLWGFSPSQRLLDKAEELQKEAEKVSLVSERITDDSYDEKYRAAKKNQNDYVRKQLLGNLPDDLEQASQATVDRQRRISLFNKDKAREAFNKKTEDKKDTGPKPK